MGFLLTQWQDLPLFCNKLGTIRVFEDLLTVRFKDILENYG